MSFERIEAVIIAEAEADAKRIIEEARGESEKTLAEARRERERLFEEAVSHAEAAAERETAREVGLARHEGRLQALDAKNRMLDGIFHKAAERIQSVSDKEYLDLMIEWLNALPPEIGGSLRVGPRDKDRFSPEFIELVNRSRPETGKFTAVEVDSRIMGGFVVIGEYYTINATIDNRVNELRETLAGNLARELFGS